MFLAEGAPGRGWGGANIHALPRHMDAAPLESEPGHFTVTAKPLIHGRALPSWRPSLEADLFCDDDRVECRAAKKLVAAHK